MLQRFNVPNVIQDEIILMQYRHINAFMINNPTIPSDMLSYVNDNNNYATRN